MVLLLDSNGKILKVQTGFIDDIDDISFRNRFLGVIAKDITDPG